MTESMGHDVVGHTAYARRQQDGAGRPGHARSKTSLHAPMMTSFEAMQDTEAAAYDGR